MTSTETNRNLKIEFYLLINGVTFTLLSVLLGAFAAHGLEKLVDARAIASFNTGVRYQMYHGLALILLANIPQIASTTKKRVGMFFWIGTILFSVSIYLLSIDELLSFSFKKIAWITPVGGLLLIIGWAYLLLILIKNLKRNDKTS
ncbi:DUF423 domain-containing protein [Aquimarina sp. ERC-38]|uniref:DUF423 domain-containing protein n=1 Tax=Aquimarina sp. ERC-38 TaxID=2949996 RepID=UPI0022484600|nr:DUF423 domain-containing protein [Aquimarina sp. ERC-38]UZO82022.1 DUF423 domain-containing protein [Aquimarina sp. ERC-38]